MHGVFPLPFFVVLGLCCCRGFSLVAVCRLLIAVFSRGGARAPGLTGFSGRSTRLQSSWCTGLVVEQYYLLPGVRIYNLDDKGG